MIGQPLVKSFRFLKERVMNPIKHYFLPKQFTFITLAPQQNLEFKSFPVEEWRVKKYFYLYLVGDWVYTMKYNENVMYYYYLYYPLGMKLLESNIYHCERLLTPFL